jgi:hypothetical protein
MCADHNTAHRCCSFSPDHGIEIHTLPAWYRRQVARGLDEPAQPIDWLGIPEQLLLSVTAGAVLRDDLGELTALRQRLRYLPPDVWLLKLSAQWARIGEEQAFVGRAGDNGDDIGSRISRHGSCATSCACAFS